MNNYTKDGMKSFHENKGKYINPYRPGSNEYNDFERGWTQALKQSPDQILKKFKLI